MGASLQDRTVLVVGRGGGIAREAITLAARDAGAYTSLPQDATRPSWNRRMTARASPTSTSTSPTRPRSTRWACGSAPWIM